MKKIIIILVIGFFAQALIAQESKPKFKIHAMDIEFNVNSFSPRKVKEPIQPNIGEEGLSFNIDLIFEYTKNRFALNYMNGNTVEIWGQPKQYNEFAFSYGRELVAAKHISIEAYAGLGHFNWKIPYYEANNKVQTLNLEAITLPLTAKFDYIFNKKITLGINMGYNVNEIKNYGSLGIGLGMHF